MMAEGWARYTGRPGVAVVTAGPGVVNSFPGVAIAHQWAGGATRRWWRPWAATVNASTASTSPFRDPAGSDP